jgi:hypothetical protein
MRTVFVVALASCLAWAAGQNTEAIHGNPSCSAQSTPNNPWQIELSRDNGNIQSAWVYLNGAGTYAGDQYETSATIDHLDAIKYYVWSEGWPDTVYQGFSVACWKVVSSTPGDMIWPDYGVPVYNPNTGGNWIVQYTDWVPLFILAPEGFVVGIGFLYTYPAMDGFGVDNTGPGPYDWAYSDSTWQAAPYGKGSARALLWGMAVEPTTLGSLRAMYR